MRSSASRSALFPLACAFVIGVMASPGRAHEPDASEIALGSLVDAELAFARMGAQRGVRAAFLAYFADDGVVFEPAPVRLRETWSARPAPADPLAFRLEWTPAHAGVAHSGDLGYTTGPSRVSAATQPNVVRHGVFFSVWERRRNGAWQVVLDVGITTPGAVDFAALGPAPRPGFQGASNAAAERARLLAREAHTGAGGAGITPAGYARLVTSDVRLHRDARLPAASRADVAAAVAQTMARVVWTPIDARISAAADMAVTFGRYREIDHGRRVREGYYAHLWLRDRRGAWRLAYDIALAAAPG